MGVAKQGRAVGVKPAGDGIEVRFKLRGKTFRPRLALPATKSNLLHAERAHGGRIVAYKKVKP